MLSLLPKTTFMIATREFVSIAIKMQLTMEIYNAWYDRKYNTVLCCKADILLEGFPYHAHWVASMENQSTAQVNL